MHGSVRLMSDPLYNEDEGSEPATKPPTKAKAATVALPVEETPLDRLKTLISQKVERTVVLLEVPDREGVHLRISPNINQAQMKAWRKNSGEETKHGLDAIKFACMVVGQTCVGVDIDGAEVFDEAGNSLNFAAPEILIMTGTTKPVPDAVKAFFGTDPHVEGAALAILEAAGYGDTIETVDPTN